MDEDRTVTADDIAWFQQARYVACAECDGDGIIRVERGGWWYGSHVDVDEYTCRHCGGSGDPCDTPIDGVTA